MSRASVDKDSTPRRSGSSTDESPSKPSGKVARDGTPPPSHFQPAEKKEVVFVDYVHRDIFWRNKIEKDLKYDKVWKQNWSFLADFDPKGNPKSPQPAPPNTSIYSDTLPNNSGASYGRMSEPGKEAVRLDFLCQDNRHRLRKLDKEFAYLFE